MKKEKVSKNFTIDKILHSKTANRNPEHIDPIPYGGWGHMTPNHIFLKISKSVDCANQAFSVP